MLRFEVLLNTPRKYLPTTVEAIRTRSNNESQQALVSTIDTVKQRAREESVLAITKYTQDTWIKVVSRACAHAAPRL